MFDYDTQGQFDCWNMHGMLLDKILPMRKFDIKGLLTLAQEIDAHGWRPYVLVFTAVLYVWMVVLLIYHYPWKAERKKAKEGVQVTYRGLSKEAAFRKVLMIRCGLNLIVILLAVWAYGFGVIRNIYLHFWG